MKTVSNIQEVKAREGIVIALVNEGDKEASSIADPSSRFRRRVNAFLPILESFRCSSGLPHAVPPRM